MFSGSLLSVMEAMGVRRLRTPTTQIVYVAYNGEAVIWEVDFDTFRTVHRSFRQGSVMCFENVILGR